MAAPQKLAELVTVTSHDYLPGTQVMLHSFLRHNPWFDGQIVILHDDLQTSDMAAIETVAPGIAFAGPSPELTRAVASLTDSFPKLAGRQRRFLSLDAFHPHRKGRALFCDSDLLFRGDISAMLDMDGPLVACGDRAQITGAGRDPISMAEHQTSAVGQSFASFNAGLMVLDETLRTPSVWSEFLALLSPEEWRHVTSDHTDQAIYNRCLGNQVELADPSYNYLVGHAGRVRSAMETAMSDAKVLHFNGPAKPWAFARHLDAATQDAGFIKAAEQWYEAYGAFLSAHHFAAAQK